MKRMTRLTFISLLTVVASMGAGAALGQEKRPETSALNASLFYDILVGELGLQSGDSGSAFSFLLNAARKANSAPLFERAVNIALRARAGDSAMQAAQAWAKAFPESREANRYLIQILIGLNKLTETVEPIKRELTALKTDERNAFMELLPRYFVRAGDKKLAATVVEQALAGELGNLKTGANAWSVVGTMRLLDDNRAGATEAAQKGAAINGKAPEPAQLALALMDRIRPAAEAVVTQYLKNNANNELQMEYVRKLLDAQRYDDVTRQVQDLTTRSPGFADAWLVRGSLELQNKDFAAAKASINRYIQIAKGDTAGESSTYERGLVQAWFLLSQIAEATGNFNEAMGYLDAVTQPQDLTRVQTRRAILLSRQGKVKEAQAMLRTIPEDQPDAARNKLYTELQILRTNKLFQEAWSLLSEAVKKNPDDADLMYELALAAERIGKVAEMETLLRKLIAAKPDYHSAYNALGYSLADRDTKLDEARALISKALSFAPDDPYIIDSMGWVEFRSGNREEALRLLQSAFKAKPDAEIAAHLGEVLWSMGQRPQAQAIWKEGLALNPENEVLKETIKRLDKPAGKP